MQMLGWECRTEVEHLPSNRRLWTKSIHPSLPQLLALISNVIIAYSLIVIYS